MTMESYEVSFSVKPVDVGNVEKNISDLFKMWQRQADECSWDTEVGICEMIYRFNKKSGDFVFVSGGEREIPLAMSDDTLAILRDIGRFASCPTVVRHTVDGRPADFVVGADPAAKAKAVDKAKLENAVSALEDVRSVVGADALVDVEKVQVALQALMTCDLD